MDIRRARPADATVIGDLYWRARAAAEPAIPPSVHPRDDVLRHFAVTVLPELDVWVADDGGKVVGLLALDTEWIEHLYIEPSRTSEGIGSALLEHAKRRQPAGLELWAFQSNVGARRFYERHGFTAVTFTDGDNEEGAPDVRYRWDGD